MHGGGGGGGSFSHGDGGDIPASLILGQQRLDPQGRNDALGRAHDLLELCDLKSSEHERQGKMRAK